MTPKPIPRHPVRRHLACPILVFVLAACGGPGTSGSGEATSAAPLPQDAVDACVLTPPEEPVACTMEYVPVCGCDGKTYGNACAAGAAGVPRSTPGACEESAD